MKIVILYRPNSEHSSSVEVFIHDLQSRHMINTTVQIVDIDSIEGSSIARNYDVVRYPAILVMRDDSILQMMWQGDALPLIDEVAGYTRS
jgi:hypothetical protein